MRFVAYRREGRDGLALRTADGLRGLPLGIDPQIAPLRALLARGGDALSDAARTLQASGELLPLDEVTFQPPISEPSKIICVGLNYRDHSAESGFEQPLYPTLFSRFASSLIGHGTAIVRPKVSHELDWEGELVAIVGTIGRHIDRDHALDHIAGYSIFNDASIRDYQFKSPQWTVGKNFDDTGAFGPEFVTADELPAGARGLALTTRLNGEVMQHANTDDMVFDIAELIVIVSEAMTLEPGDVIVTGTPAGVGIGRKPPRFMVDGDKVEVEVEGVGVLGNPIVDEK